MAKKFFHRLTLSFITIIKLYDTIDSNTIFISNTVDYNTLYDTMDKLLFVYFMKNYLNL
mgnify:CR=1 FL=1